jgi:hypothetical protein
MRNSGMPSSPQTDQDFVVVDVDYFRTKAQQCFRLANATGDPDRRATLVSLGNDYDYKATALAVSEESENNDDAVRS